MPITIKKNALIVLDLDDTLYAEIDFLESGFRQTADFIISHNFKDPYEEMLFLYKAGRYPFQELISKYNYPFAANELIDIYRNHVPEIKLYEDARAFLERAGEAGNITGLITDGRSITQRNKINALGIEKYFSDIIISEEFGSAKPAVENYQYFIHKYPDQVYYYIGDNFSKDFIAPNRLGWNTIGIIDKGNHIHPQDKQLETLYLPHYTINSFSEISIT